MKNNIVSNKVGIMVEDKKRLLLIKELNTSDNKYYWNIIKGTFEPENDKDYFAAAMRECKEETGIDIKITHLLNVMYLSNKEKNKYINQFNFIASVKKGVPTLPKIEGQKERGEDIIEVKFFEQKDLVRMKKDVFMNERAFLAVKDWMKNLRYDLKVLKFIEK